MIDLHDLPQVRRLADLIMGAPGIPTHGEPFVLALQSMVLNTVAAAHAAGRYADRDDLLDEVSIFLGRCFEWSVGQLPPGRLDEVAEHARTKRDQLQAFVDGSRVTVSGGALTPEDLAELVGEGTGP
jgi:hypothetical protein